MKISIHEIANVITADFSGDAQYEIDGVSSFEDASATELTFASEAKFLHQLSLTSAKAIIVPESICFDDQDVENKIILKTANPKLSFFKIVSLFHPLKKTSPFICDSAIIGNNCTIGIDPQIHPNVVIGDQVTIGDNVCIMPGVYIGDDVRINDHTIIKPNVTIMEKSQIGSNVIIHSGTVIGSDGFGFAQDKNQHHKLMHTGYVIVGDHSEIGACNTIDRGTLGTTVIGCGVKTDNQVHIAHNVKIGDNTLLVAQVGIAGSAQIGKNVIAAGKAGITGHIKIGDNTIIGPFAGVSSDVDENQVVSGVPHMPHGTWLKISRILSRLPEMRKKLFSFEKRLNHIENKKNERS